MITKLRYELDTVEERFKKVINENSMVGEDYRMRAAINFERYTAERVRNSELKQVIIDKEAEMKHLTDLCP